MYHLNTISSIGFHLLAFIRNPFQARLCSFHPHFANSFCLFQHLSPHIHCFSVIQQKKQTFLSPKLHYTRRLRWTKRVQFDTSHILWPKQNTSHPLPQQQFQINIHQNNFNQTMLVTRVSLTEYAPITWFVSMVIKNNYILENPDPHLNICYIMSILKNQWQLCVAYMRATDHLHN